MDFSSMSMEQFHNYFSTEDLCIDYIRQSKWPEGFICPRCNHRHAYVTLTRRLPLYECSHCRHQTSLISGTVMEGSRTELRKWLLALFLISRTDKSINAVELSNMIQVTYKTAWLMLHKIRHAIHAADQRVLLTGSVRVHSAVYGRPYNPSIRRHPQQHLLLLGSSITAQGDCTYLKMQHIIPETPSEKHFTRSDTVKFQKNHIDPQTDDIEWVTGFYSPKRLRFLMSFANDVSEWINDTFHGLGPKHLQLYLAEFSFRLNTCLQNEPIFTQLSRLCCSRSHFFYSYEEEASTA